MTYYTRGNVFEEQGDKAQAAEEYKHALALDPRLGLAREALLRVGQ
jgi:Tfp pilus assembly protein PilF